MKTTLPKILESLNSAQLRAVTTDADQVLCLAGAGSGKTRALTRRAAHLVQERGFSPYDVLVVTFTNKAADEMRARIEELIGERDAKKMRIVTFHSLALWICNQWAEKLGLASPITIYDADDQADIVKFLIKKKHKCKLAPKAIIKLLSGKPIVEGGSEASIINEYYEILRDANALDFQSMLVAAETLLEYEEVQKHYHQKFKHVLMDEAQDTNPIQMRIIEAIDPENLFMVGDDYQSIYGFRGADVQVMWDFSEREGVEVIRMVENYRSVPEIVRLANNLISHNEEQLHKELKAMRDEPRRIQTYTEYHDDPWAEAKVIAGEIKLGALALRDDLNQVAILGRTHRHLKFMKDALAEAGIPFQLISGKDTWSTEPARILTAFLKVIRNPADNWSFGYILRTLVKLTALDQNELETIRSKELMTLLEAARNQAMKGTPIWDVVGFINSSWPDHWEASDITEYLMARVPIEQLYRYHHLDTKAGQFQEVLEAIQAWEARTEGSPDYGDFLDWLSGRMMQDRIQDVEAVTVATVHAAKGLEWDVVFLAGFHEGGFPYSKWKTEDGIAGALEEERRIAYVGITRARDHLVISVPRQDAFHRRVDASRFIKEMQDGKQNQS